MKQLPILFLFAAFFSLLSGCRKDNCESIICLNGGACNDGSCECPEGYSGSKCETFDACFNITCLNGGNCVNGQCNCPEGYTGADCSQLVTPDKIRINKIEVTRFPATDNGAGWDFTSGPDIYPEISKGFTTLYSYSSFYQNADPSVNHVFEINPAVELNDANDQYSINLYDYDDFDSDDFMGGILFFPYVSNDGFPTKINLDAGGSVSFTLHVSYVW